MTLCPDGFSLPLKDILQINKDCQVLTSFKIFRIKRKGMREWWGGEGKRTGGKGGIQPFPNLHKDSENRH